MGKKPKFGHQPNPQKSPRVAKEPQPSKTPKAGYIEDAMDMSPSWRFTLAEMVPPWGWHELSGERMRAVLSRLVEYEGKTWKVILVNEQYRNHDIEQWKICKEARDRLEELQLDDAEYLTSFRIGSRERIWGIRDHNILHLLWWDPEHLVYPVEKKNT